jgi:hypothetical protein
MHILHISDLHVAPAVLSRNVSQALGEASKLGYSAFDFIVVSGDIVNSPDTKSYEERIEFLRTLAARLNIDVSHIVCVPGNHDAAWDRSHFAPVPLFDPGVTKAAISGAASPHDSDFRAVVHESGHLALWKIKNPSDYHRRFSAYREFQDGLYGKHSASGCNKLFTFDAHDGSDQWSLHCFEQQRVAFVGLNSAWRSDVMAPDCVCICAAAIDAARKALQRLLDGRRDRDAWTVIAVWHHGTTSTTYRRDLLAHDVAGSIIESDFDIGMHGHVHYSDVKFHNAYGRSIPIFGVGSLGADRDQRPDVGNQAAILRIVGKTVEQLTITLQGPGLKHLPTKKSVNLRSRDGQEAGHVLCGSHRREVRITDAGICDVKVHLDGVRSSGGTVVLASFLSSRTRVDEDDVTASPSGRKIRVNRRVLADQSSDIGLAMTADIPNADQDGVLDWRYLAPNLVPLCQQEEQFYGERAPVNTESWPMLGHWVTMPCGELHIDYEFPRPPQSVHKICMRHLTNGAWRMELIKDRVETDRMEMTWAPGDTTARLRVAYPVMGAKYGIAIKQAARQGGAAPYSPAWLKVLVGSDRSEQQEKLRRARKDLQARIRVWFGKYHPNTKVDADWALQVWADSRELATIAYYGGLDLAAMRFGWGDGVAGHALRMGEVVCVTLEDGALDSADQRLTRILYNPMPTGSMRVDTSWVVALPLMHHDTSGKPIAPFGVFWLRGRSMEAGVTQFLAACENKERVRQLYFDLAKAVEAIYNNGSPLESGLVNKGAKSGARKDSANGKEK